MDYLRIFNDKGINEFKKYLKSIENGSLQALPQEFLDNPDFSELVAGDMVIEKDKFNTRFEAAKYLHEILKSCELDNKYYNTGLWTWLAAYYFDQICPTNKTGIRKVYSDYRYILNTGEWDRIFRHLLAGPVVMYDYHKDNAKLLLSNPLDKTGDFVIQLMGRQEIARNRVIIEVANKLYWDQKRYAPKRGATSTDHKPGTLRRFVTILQQFELTYDFYSMTPEELMCLLPNEFEKWK